MANDINRAEDYFRRSKDKGGETKNLARGLMHLIKHLSLTDGRDFGRANELLDQAWKKSGGDKKMAEAMWLVARELKKKKKVRRTKATAARDEFGLIKRDEEGVVIEDDEVTAARDEFGFIRRDGNADDEVPY